MKLWKMRNYWQPDPCHQDEAAFFLGCGGRPGAGRLLARRIGAANGASEAAQESREAMAGLPRLPEQSR